MNSAIKFGLFGAACAALLALAPTTQAMRIMPPSPGIRAAQATVIVVGKVESIEEKTVLVKPFPDAPDKVEYKIAIVKVSDPILGAKGVTNVRVGFIPPPPPPMGKPGGPVLIRPGRGNLTFTKDQEGIFFLTPHADGNFLVAQGFNDFVNKQGNPNFDKEVEETKKFIKILDNPKESLKADKQEDRFTAAAILVSKFRTQRPGVKEVKTEAVDEETSKLILTALGEADWKAQNGKVIDFRMNPLNIFMQLGVTEKDGYNPPMMEVKNQPQGQPQKVVDYAKLPDYAKQWCKDNAGKYKIQRFVHEEKKDKSDK